jgi:hypothetical protein
MVKSFRNEMHKTGDGRSVSSAEAPAVRAPVPWAGQSQGQRRVDDDDLLPADSKQPATVLVDDIAMMTMKQPNHLNNSNLMAAM